MHEKIYKVFICSPYSDLVEERESVLDAVRRLHLLHGSMEFFGARPRGPLETSLEEVRSSDIVIVIIGHKYGTFVPGREQSYTELEYEEAWKHEKPCLVYFRSEDVPILPSKMERDPVGIKALEKFKKKLRGRHTTAVFEKADDLAVQVAADIRRTVDFLEEKKELITERKKAEEALRESEEKYRMLVENIQDGVFILQGTPYPKLVFGNDAFAKMVGYTKEEMLGSTFQQYIAPEDLERFVNHYHQSKEGVDVPRECEYRMLHKDGRLLYVDMHAGLIEYQGEVATIGTLKDITERKRIEDELVRLFKDLEAKNIALERFAYTVSHDLRSPLVTIRGFTDMVQNDLEQNELEKAENSLKYIDKAATKMERLLSDTLELSRIGRVANPPEDVPFGAIVEDALEQIAEQIKSSGVKITVADSLSTVHVDRIRIVGVVVELIGNSIKFRGEQQHPKIVIGYRVDSEEPVFFVQDNGIGIGKSQHEKMFELFYQGDQSGEGTGAGLAIVKRIIEVHGGRIWIESEKGEGCTVCFTLPTESRIKFQFCV